MSEPPSDPPKRSLSRRFWNPRDLRDYLLQVTLIILSILIATSVDRCNQARKDARDLEEYLAAIRLDLQENIEENKLNLFDAQQDVAGLQRALALLQYNADDSLALASREILSVLDRGVFRSFPPTTFELMQATGDVRLIRNFELRQILATAFAFQENYVKTDLAAYDAQVATTIKQLGAFIDLGCVVRTKSMITCFIDRDAFLTDPHNELVLLQQVAVNRAFHLERANQGLRYALEGLDAWLE